MGELPVWWPAVPQQFRECCEYVDVREWPISKEVEIVRAGYYSRFGREAVDKRVPENNWKRAGLCCQMVPTSLAVMDVGSGLGEFVNLFAVVNENTPIASVDIKDYSLWFDLTGRVERINKSIFELSQKEASDVVTCFEVIEHLPSERLAEAVRILRSLAKTKLFVSIPFMESLPLYKGHFTRFDPELLGSLFPDARFTIFGKGGRSATKVMAWIMCEVAIEQEVARAPTVA